MSHIVWFLAVLITATSEKVRYDGYTMYRSVPHTEAQLEFLKTLQGKEGLAFWIKPISVERFVSVLVSPENRSELEQLFVKHGIEATVMMENIQTAIDSENYKRYRQKNMRSMKWDGYYALEDINEWLKDLASAYPDKVTSIIGGYSHEGREIRGVKICFRPGRRAIFLEGGIHSREWISPATLTYITNELIHSVHQEIREAVEDFDWYIFPVINPDGYVFTFESNRLWRKNRRSFGKHFGVDLNRNWDIHWLSEGSSADPASDMYAGPAPFSENETRTLSSFISSIGHKIDLYLAFHSYSQLMMVPYGNTTAPLGNYWDAVNIGKLAAQALSRRYGTQYTVGNIAETIYPATGSSLDWVKEEFGVPIAFGYELRDRGQLGFLLPAEQIRPNCEEVMDSLISIIRESKLLGYLKS